MCLGGVFGEEHGVVTYRGRAGTRTGRKGYHLTKTKCMLFGTKQKLANASFKTQLHGSDIERVRNFCYLGVTLEECLSWKEHVS